MIQSSEGAQATTDPGEKTPMHRNASYEDIGNTDIEFAYNVRKTISEGTRLARSFPTAPGPLSTELGQLFCTR